MFNKNIARLNKIGIFVEYNNIKIKQMCLITITIQAEHETSVIAFRRFAYDTDIRNNTKNLKTKLQDQEIENTGKIFFQGYNPPFQLFNLTNRIGIETLNYEQ